MDRVGRFPYTSRLTAQAGYAQVAQLVEQRIENPRVAGSIPALGTITLFHSPADADQVCLIIKSCCWYSMRWASSIR